VAKAVAEFKIERAYVERDGLSEWEEITEVEFLRRTEWAGYYEKGCALEALKAVCSKPGGCLNTPFQRFRIKA